MQRAERKHQRLPKIDVSGGSKSEIESLTKQMEKVYTLELDLLLTYIDCLPCDYFPWVLTHMWLYMYQGIARFVL